MKLTNKVLYRPAKPFADFDHPAQNSFLATQMFLLMKKNNGIGLAAPQIGVSRRLFVMEIDQIQRACFNPEITDSSADLTEYIEGCLSFPQDECKIKRPSAVSVRYQNVQGTWIEEQLQGLEARCFQHELDHLDGITMHDRAKEQHATES
jgi:peptide deformylase